MASGEVAQPIIMMTYIWQVPGKSDTFCIICSSCETRPLVLRPGSWYRCFWRITQPHLAQWEVGEHTQTQICPTNWRAHTCKWSTNKHSYVSRHTHTKKNPTQKKKDMSNCSFSNTHKHVRSNTQLCVSVSSAARVPVKRGRKWCLSFPVGRGSALHHSWFADWQFSLFTHDSVWS